MVLHILVEKSKVYHLLSQMRCDTITNLWICQERFTYETKLMLGEHLTGLPYQRHS